MTFDNVGIAPWSVATELNPNLAQPMKHANPSTQAEVAPADVARHPCHILPTLLAGAFIRARRKQRERFVSNRCASWLLLLALPCAGADAAAVSVREAEIVIYGGTAGGIAAGIQAKRMGRDVVVVEPSAHIGGLTTGGLGQTDIGAKHVIGGIAREFYRGIRSHYQQPEAWKWQRREDYRDGGQTRTDSNEDTMWTFEPTAAKAVLNAMIENAGLTVIRNERLDRAHGVTKNGARIAAIRFESGLEVRGRMFIDATYEGDLLAAAGVRYRVGRESNAEYGETLNGVQTDRYARTLAHGLSLNAGNHQLASRVDPYRSPGDASSGLLPGIRSGGPGIEGAGDAGVQAYCYRVCLTNHADNRVPFARPADYDELNYELLLRHLEADPNARIWINSDMPNRKTDTNNGGGFSGDFIGGNHRYPEAGYAERAAIAAAHRSYQQGLY
ncbi:MAG TPA: FAD-dependent oxidoreductase, partial [Opitutus sp.]|nr:FAD-dependent oxidoreductase [Opitutus sp.]